MLELAFLRHLGPATQDFTAHTGLQLHLLWTILQVAGLFLPLRSVGTCTAEDTRVLAEYKRSAQCRTVFDPHCLVISSFFLVFYRKMPVVEILVWQITADNKSLFFWLQGLQHPTPALSMVMRVPQVTIVQKAARSRGHARQVYLHHVQMDFCQNCGRFPVMIMNRKQATMKWRSLP